MRATAPSLAPVLRSDVQGKLLAVVFAEPEAEHSVTELARRAGTSVQTAIREVGRAEAARLVTTRRIGNTRLVKADQDGRLYRPFSEIVLATFGPPAVLREELAELEGVDQAYLFGSWAARYAGEAGRAPNDVDVLVVGRPDRDSLYEAAERAERRLGMPVQVTVRSRAQWEKGTDPFLSEVRSRPLVPIFDEDEQ